MLSCKYVLTFRVGIARSIGDLAFVLLGNRTQRVPCHFQRSTILDHRTGISDSPFPHHAQVQLCVHCIVVTRVCFGFLQRHYSFWRLLNQYLPSVNYEKHATVFPSTTAKTSWHLGTEFEIATFWLIISDLPIILLAPLTS